ncbi:hypothetical protein [Lentzea flava]|uniref:Uncharacterized protein n=1 Tax=Lentzea flava TaxID=103732 RepID=A0ABQ2VF26_9PSEU|nr:hypothetical protein [Lentzea flava]GGU81081.1 hypothetical protein GCM10010178_84730 [Lentzea flava]
MSWPITTTPLSTTPPPRVERTAEVLASPVGDYLRDPLGGFQNVLAHLRGLALTWGPIVGPVLAVAVTAAVIARRRWRRRYHQRLMTDARLVTVLAPPTVDPSGAITV